MFECLYNYPYLIINSSEAQATRQRTRRAACPVRRASAAAADDSPSGSTARLNAKEPVEMRALDGVSRVHFAT